MIFIKQYLIKLTFVVISVWAMPAATELSDMNSLICKDILIYNDYNICVITFVEI